jgi:hypothetical protein
MQHQEFSRETEGKFAAGKRWFGSGPFSGYPLKKSLILEDAMKKIGAKVVYLALGFLSFVGIWPASATPVPQPQANHLNEVKTTTPLYLKHSVDLLPKYGQEKDLRLSAHWNHWSHRNHSSHWAHHAHRAHYSHYNGYGY